MENETRGALMNSSSINLTWQFDEDIRSRASAILVLTLMINLVGNTLLVVSLLRTRKSSRYELGPVQSLILQAAFADVAFAIIGILPQLLRMLTLPVFYGNDFLCRFVSYIQVVPMFATSYFGIAIAIDRYIAICMPLASIRLKYSRVKALTLSTWVISLVFALPQFAIFRLHKIPQLTSCVSTQDMSVIKPYMIWFCLSAWLGPTVIISIFYTLVLVTIWRSSSTSFRIRYSKRSQRTTSNLNSGRPRGYSTTSADTACTRLSPTWSFRKLFNKSNQARDLTQSLSTPGLHSVKTDNFLSVPQERNGVRQLKESQSSGEVISSANPSSTSTSDPTDRESDNSQCSLLERLTSRNFFRSTQRGSTVNADCCFHKTKPPVVTRRKIQTIKLTLTIIICHFVLWSPFCITGFTTVFFPRLLDGVVAAYILLTGNLNSCVNPWIYFFFHRNRLVSLIWGQKPQKSEDDQTSGYALRKLTISHQPNNFYPVNASSAKQI